jgi:uncharacterized membrane protein YhhN
LRVLGLVLFFVGLIPFAVAFLRPVKNGKLFAACFGATIVVSGIGFVLLWT